MAATRSESNVFVLGGLVSGKCEWCSGMCEIGPGPSSMSSWERTRCLTCGAFGYTRLPGEDELNVVYASAWDDEGELGELATGSTSEAMSRSLFKAVGWTPEKRQKCLDYGGGHGALANMLVTSGCDDVWAYEPYSQGPAPEKVRWVTSLERLPDSHFDWVFMIEVIEHLRHPVESLKGIRRIMSPGGKLVITTPNAKGLRARLDGYRWREAQNPTHLNLFTARALRNCLQDAGFLNAAHLYRPVRYNATGISAVALSITQRLGLDGGLRYVVQI